MGALQAYYITLVGLVHTITVHKHSWLLSLQGGGFLMNSVGPQYPCQRVVVAIYIGGGGFSVPNKFSHLHG